MLNALCYFITGIASFVVSTQPGAGKGWPIVIGIGAILYGAKILCTRTSYWVSSAVYLTAIVSVGWAVVAIQHH